MQVQRIIAGMRSDATSSGLRSGDLLITPHAFPMANHIVQASRQREIFFYPAHLEQLLQFLECVVLYERVIVGTCQVESPLVERVLSSDIVERMSPGRVISEHYPVADLLDSSYDKLKEAGILIEQLVRLPATSRDVFEKQVATSGTLRRRITDCDDGLRSEESDPELRRELAVLIEWDWAGRPFYLAEVARAAGIPHHLAWWEVDNVAAVESEERSVITSIAGRLSSRLTEGARTELQRIRSLGGRTVFPETPIAWEILACATTAEDLVEAALQLRSEYSAFRRHIQEVEVELRSDDVTTAKKIRVVAEIERVVEQLWPVERRGLRREVSDSLSFVAALPTNIPTTLSSITGTALGLLSQPIDMLLRVLRHRRYRLLFRSKRRFLRRKGDVDRVAHIFGLPRDVVQTGIDLNKQLG